jgi:hypothetical protein
MSEQLSKQGIFDHRRKYNADGAIRLSDLGNLKVVVVEISGKFKNCLERKISFDNAEDVCVIGNVKGCRRPPPLCNCIQPSCKVIHFKKEMCKLIEYNRLSYSFVVDEILQERNLLLCL